MTILDFLPFAKPLSRLCQSCSTIAKGVIDSTSYRDNVSNNTLRQILKHENYFWTRF